MSKKIKEEKVPPWKKKEENIKLNTKVLQIQDGMVKMNCTLQSY
jgi:hypothetical protein